MRDFSRLARLAAAAASDKKAEDIELFHIKPMSGLADYLLLATVESAAQLEAVEENVEKALKAKGLRPLRRDGSGTGTWTVLDYGGLLVHLMHRETRAFYALEKLYAEARRVAWDAKAPPRRRPARKRHAA